jgi:hypothetical protein
MRMRELCLAGLSVIALAGLPAAAAAARRPPAPKREIQQPSTSGVFYLGAAGGFNITVSNPSRHVAILYVDRLGGLDDSLEYTVSSYAVRPRTSLASGVLRARFGSIGQVVLRFHPNGKVKLGSNEKHCRGRRPQNEFGKYRGHISLAGENGYFRLHAREGEGERTHTFRLRCAPGQAANEKSKPLYEYIAPSEGFSFGSAGGDIALLRAIGRFDRRYVSLRATHRKDGGPGAEVLASVLEIEPGMAIGRLIQVNGEAGTLRTSLPGEHPATATLAPPAPFHGEASYLENSPTSHSWTGTLAVSFPGLDLPLTGTGYATSLCVLSPFKSPLPCELHEGPLAPE